MSFQNRSQFVNAQASEKIVLAQLQATARLFNWSVYSGSVYNRNTDYFVYALKQDQTPLTQVFSIGAVVAGTWFYDIETGTLYVRTIGSVNPATVEMIVTYQFYYGNTTINAPWNLVDGQKHVLYQGRISSNPGYKHKVGIEQGLSSLVGQGDLVLENNDGGLDGIFDTLFFENHECFIYSWNRDLDYNDAKLIYRGRVTNKSYNGQSVTFTIKDQMYDLEQKVPQSVFTDSDNVNDNIKGQIKRWVYGRVDGLQTQSIDQIGQGYTITGTVNGNTTTTTVTGVGTLFLSEVSPNDTLTIGTQEFTIESVIDNTQLVINDEPTFAFSGETAILLPEIPTVNKNRTFFVADHACAKLTKTLISIIQLNRIELNDTDGLFVGDFLEFDTLERVEIKQIAPNNVVVLRQNLILVPTLLSDVIREPIQSVFIEGKFVRSENYTISNLGNPTHELTITLSNDAEFDLAKAHDLGVQLTFTNGTRNITTTEDVDLRELLSPRDWIRPATITYTTYYEILAVNEQSIELRVNFADPTITDDVQAKLPDYIGDDTIISVNVLGKTEDGEPEGTWISTAAQTVKDLVTEIGITNFNNISFDNAEATSSQLISLTLPLSKSASLTSTKDAIDLINKSVYGSLTLDDDLNLQYRILKNDIPTEPRIIRDSDVVSWKIKTTNGKNFRNSIIHYRHQDYNRYTKQSGNSVIQYESEFVRDYIGTNQTSELDVYLYNQIDAEIMSHRYVYFNRLGRSDVTIETDLRLEDVEIGDVIQLEFARLYKRFGDDETRKKLMLVIGLTKSGEKLTIEATDLNNTFNSTAVITPNVANPYTSATTDEKLHYGYITTNQGIVNNEETTSNINLIS
jgi:hypothetical protein